MTPVFLVLFVVLIIVLGQPIEGAEVIYFDADYVEDNDTGESVETTTPTDYEDAPAEIVSQEVDTEALANDIFQSVDL